VKQIAADSGPLIVFARSGLLEIARQVTGDILVPAVVFAECCRDPGKPGALALIQANESGFFQVQPDARDSIPPNLRRIANLDDGEIAVLTLAAAKKCPALMDERLGRTVAVLNGISVVGSAGLLLTAKERGLIQEIAPILAVWRSWGYFLAPALVGELLSRAGEGS
jgi:predicted nucleic acid-binding protein